MLPVVWSVDVIIDEDTTSSDISVLGSVIVVSPVVLPVIKIIIILIIITVLDFTESGACVDVV